MKIEIESIDWEGIALLIGASIVEIIPTPQNRDRWRREYLKLKES